MSKSPDVCNELVIFKNGAFTLDLKVLTHLYLPVIGKTALSAYLWLFSESDFLLNESIESTVYRLAVHLNMAPGRVMKHVINILEGVSLVKTYLDNTRYICVVERPLTAAEFNNTALLSQLLRGKLTQKEWERTAAFMNRQPWIPDGSFNISKTFESFYKRAIKTIEVDEKKGETAYDFNLLKARLNERGLMNVALNKTVRSRIAFLSSLYDFHPGEVSIAIENCLKENNGKLTPKMLSSSFTDLYVSRGKEEPNTFFTLKGHQDTLNNLRPSDFISLHEDRSPTTDELDFISNSSAKLNLDDKIINVLIHYSLVKNKRIVIPYLVKVAKTISTLEYDSVKDVLKYLKTAYKKSNEKSSSNLNKTEEKIDRNLNEAIDFFEGKK